MNILANLRRVKGDCQMLWTFRQLSTPKVAKRLKRAPKKLADVAMLLLKR